MILDKSDPYVGGKFSALPALTNAPIEFYGKVVDEEGAALSGERGSGDKKEMDEAVEGIGKGGQAIKKKWTRLLRVGR